MKEVMGGLIINDEVMDHFIDLEPAHISWAWMMGARTPEEIRTLGLAIQSAQEYAGVDHPGERKTLPEDGSGLPARVGEVYGKAQI